jgi:7-carboxy-7-deazaguanine synthase
MSLDQIIERVRAYQCPLAEITGGEPLLQRGVHDLIERLLNEGKTVLLETGGHRSIQDVHPDVIRIVDVKCPASGESKRNHWNNLDLLNAKDQVKFVLADRTDYEFAREIIRKWSLVDRCTVLMSPVHTGPSLQHISQWILEDGLSVRLQIQLHKVIWGSDARGV